MTRNCRPCGECASCRANRKARADVKALRQALHRALHQIEKLIPEAEAHFLNDPEEAHPCDVGAYDQAQRARKVAARLEPLARGRTP